SDFTKNCLINTSGGSIGEAVQQGYTYSWTSSPIGFTSSDANPSVNPSVTTTYTVTKTHAASGCSDTDDVTVTVNKPDVTANAGSDFTKTCTMNTNGGSIGEAAQEGYTYSWTSSPEGFTSTDANPSVNPSVTTTYTVTKTHTASGCSDTDDVTVTLNTLTPTPFTLHNLEICSPLPVSLLSAIQEALPDPSVESVTFWRDAQAMNDQITGSDITNFTAGPGTYTIYIKEVLLASGCSRIQQFNIDVKSCSAALCTYTQGYYGNPGGMSCAEGKPYSTYNLIAKALASYGGTMTIGSAGHSVWMTAPDDIDDIIRVMPGGGPAKVLFAGDIQISSLTPNYLKNGKINNALLAQTIALGLNIGINGNLGNFELKTGTFAVAEPEGGCGSDIPKTRQCSPGGYTPVINEFKYYSIPTKVINAISPKTVQGLFALANQALGGGSTNGLTLSEITAAVDLINNAFDECRIFVGYGVEPLECAAPVESLINTFSTDTAKVSDTSSFTAAPVPFRDQLTVSYNFDFVTDVKIEVFNTMGVVVASSYDTNGYLNKSVLLNIPYTGQEEVYIIKLTTNRGSSTQKVISSR
ncbi:T9SS type A sorting domain-containing protein, partial [Flavobacterium sp. HJJ]|uniref:T9SS type A sorting domain-containing protein n=1 Tax=Flavobacterium sp. HJJ TaxID=2783792 RepID=UPI001889CB02